MKPTKNGPIMVKAMPRCRVLGVKEAHADRNATMPKAETISQYRVLPKTLINTPAAISPREVDAETVHWKSLARVQIPITHALTDNQPAYSTSVVYITAIC